MKKTIAITAVILLITSVAGYAQPAPDQPLPGEGPVLDQAPPQGPPPGQWGPGEGFGRGGGRRASAMRRPGAGTINPMAGLHHALKQLDLTDEQREQIKAIQDENKDAQQAAHRATQEAREAMMETTANEEATEEAVRTAATELGTKIGDEAVLMIQVRNAVLAVLTDEQKAELKTLKEKLDAQGQKRQKQMQQRRQQRLNRFEGSPDDAPMGPGGQERRGFRRQAR